MPPSATASPIGADHSRSEMPAAQSRERTRLHEACPHHSLASDSLSTGLAIARVRTVGKASDWLREERRKVLGDWAAFCLGCGAVRRWFEEFEGDLPDTCPQCGGSVLHRCPACGAPFASAFAVDCEACKARLREPDLFGVPIRR